MESLAFDLTLKENITENSIKVSTLLNTTNILINLSNFIIFIDIHCLPEVGLHV